MSAAVVIIITPKPPAAATTIDGAVDVTTFGPDELERARIVIDGLIEADQA